MIWVHLNELGDEMDRQTFDSILIEEGIDDISLRNDIWNTRPGDGLDENRLRFAASQFKRSLPNLLVKKALNDAMDREYGRDK